MGAGYFAMHRGLLGYSNMLPNSKFLTAFESGPGSIALPWLCFFAFLTGIGGASAFSGSIKTCMQAFLSINCYTGLSLSAALNWPTHRGTATAFPLSGFGLGAFFFAFISNVAFPDNTSSFLLFLSLGCLSFCYLCVAFLRIVPQIQLYTPVATNEGRRSSNLLRRTRSKDSKSHHQNEEPGTLSNDSHASPPLRHDPNGDSKTIQSPDKGPDETSSLMSKSSNSGPGDDAYEDNRTEPSAHHNSHHLDIRGFALLKHTEFYQLWLLLGILTGVGLMTIK